MSASERKIIQTLARRSWLLWALAVSMVTTFALAIPLIYLPLVTGGTPERELGAQARQVYYVLTGLAGLVTVLCLFTLLRQRELHRMRDQLEAQAREKELIRSKLSELSALFQVSTSLNLQLRLDVILELIVRRVVSSLRAQQASIMLYDAGTAMLETRAAYGLEAEFARNAKKRLGEGIAGWVAERGESVILAEARPAGVFAPHYKADRNITSALSLPLRVGDRCIGVLNVNRINHPEPFLEHHRDVLSLFADHVGAVIERAEAMESLSSRTRELEADNLRLAEMNQMKDVFLSTASHELKTPLSSVIAYADLLEENEAKLEPPQRSEFLKRLRGEAGRLMRLIEDILDLSRLESGKMTLHRRALSVNEIARAALQTMRPLVERHQLRLRESLEDGLPELMLDEVKMRQVVVNLLSNAVKFSPASGEIALVTRGEPAWIVIEVRDQGPGVLPEETPHLFELFGQRLRAARGEDGLGIGLHLVKRIADLHGAHVGVNSPPGEGSVFWVRIPRTLAAEAAAAPPAGANGAAAAPDPAEPAAPERRAA